MHDPSARMARLEAPAASPGHCAICGKSEHPQGFVDPRLDYEWYGSVIFCYDCAGSLGEAVGYMGPESFANLRAQFEQQAELIRTLTQSIENLEAAHDANERVKRDRAKRAGTPAPATEQGPPADAAEPVQPATEPVGQPVSAEQGTTKSTPAPKQPAVEQGRNDLLDTSVADELLGL